MLRQLQQRADDLAESLLVHELEMKRSRTLEYRMQAFHDFEAVVDRIDALRRDAEVLLPTARAKTRCWNRLTERLPVSGAAPLTESPPGSPPRAAVLAGWSALLRLSRTSQ